MSIPARLEKLRFLAMEMQLAYRLAQFAPTDSDARMLARHVLIRAKDCIEHARQLQRPLRDAGFDTKAFHELKEYVAIEFDTYFKTVRDKLGAHIQDLEFLNRIEQWNCIDSSKVEFFADASVEIYHLLEGLGIPGFVPFGKFCELGDESFEQALIDYRGSGNKILSLEVGADALSVTRPNSVTMFNMTPVHARASQLALLHRWIGAQTKLLSRFAGYPNVIRILEARIITDIISACDCLVTRAVAPGAPQEMDGLDLLLSAMGRPQNSIEKFKLIYDIDSVMSPIRCIRDKIGSHLDVDPKVSLEILLRMLDDSDFDNVVDMYRLLRSVFEKAARESSFLVSYLADGRPIYGLTATSSGEQVSPYDHGPIQGRATPVLEVMSETDEAFAAKLEEWLSGDPETRDRARSTFWQAFLRLPIEKTIQAEEHRESSMRYHQRSFRIAHRFLLRALEEETDFDRTIGILELTRECASGDPETLAEVLLQYAESPKAAPYLFAVAHCLGDLAHWNNGRAKQFLEARLPSKSSLGIQSRIGLLRMFVRSEGLALLNRGQATDALSNVIAHLTCGYATPYRLLTTIYLVSQFCDPRIVGFVEPFSEDHASIREDIVRLAGDLFPETDAERTRTIVRRLADCWDYPGICIFLFDELKGSKYESLGRMLVEYASAGAILAANHNQSRRHLCGCLMRQERYDEALQMAEALALADPVNMSLQVLHAQALWCRPDRRAEAIRRVVEIDALYKLDADQQQIIDGLKSAIAASTKEVE